LRNAAAFQMLDAHIVKPRREFIVDVTIRVDEGEAVAFFGPTGAGKSTVLSCIAGLEEPSEGYVRFDGVQFFPPSLPVHKRTVGYLTQHSHLFPHLTVSENVRFGVPGDGTAQEHWLAELRERFQLDAIWLAPAQDLSGGQARRVSFARMLARRPQMILLDEPFAGLDRQVVRELIGTLLVWRNEHGFSMILVDHQEHVLRKLCPRVLAVEQGRIIQEGAWDQLEARPASTSVAKLLAPL